MVSHGVDADAIKPKVQGSCRYFRFGRRLGSPIPAPSLPIFHGFHGTGSSHADCWNLLERLPRWVDLWGIFKVFVIQQATFCVNSLAHWIGTQPFDDKRTPRDHFLTAFVTFGDGYHNFHHEFPSDYRSALKWYQYDPTKHLIKLTSKVGLACNLETFSQNAIEQGLIQQKQKKLDEARGQLNWGPSLSSLPVWDETEFLAISKEQKGIVIIAGIVHDLSGFITEHPGGQALVRTSVGKDATTAFTGGVYAHSNAAHNMLATMRIAVMRGSGATSDTVQLQGRMIAERGQK